MRLVVRQDLAKGKPSLPYMKNLGFRNSVNPLSSVANAKVYTITILVTVSVSALL